jgi:hypothetical protein
VNTHRLIDILSANLEAVNRRALQRALTLAIVAGVVAAFGLMLATVGPRADGGALPHLEWSAIKLLFALGVVGTGTPMLIRSARPVPGGTGRVPVVFLPFLAVGIAAVLALLLGPPNMAEVMLRGAREASPVRCLLCVVGFAFIPLVVLIRVLRESAPAQPRLCGALTGLVSGGVGAAAYTLACASDSLPFIAVWYSAAMAICALLGALIGPALLRW